MKINWKEIGITALIAIIAVGIYRNYVASAIPAAVQKITGPA